MTSFISGTLLKSKTCKFMLKYYMICYFTQFLKTINHLLLKNAAQEQTW